MWIVNGGANFLPYAILPLVAVAAVLACTHHWRLLLGVGVVVLAWSVAVMSGDRLVTVAGRCEAGERVRLMTANVLMSNDRLDDLARDVLVDDPDIVAFEELHRDLDSVSPEFAARYPYRISTDVPWVTLASRYPFESARVLPLSFDDAARAPVVATVNVNGEHVTVFAVHIMPPLNKAADALSLDQYRVLAEAIASTGNARMLAIGDFNATPFSPPFLSFLQGTGLRIASAGQSLIPTHFPRASLGLRIDHVLERGFHVCSERVVELTGSDHHGVVVDVALPSA